MSFRQRLVHPFRHTPRTRMSDLEPHRLTWARITAYIFYYFHYWGTAAPSLGGQVEGRQEQAELQNEPKFSLSLCLLTL